MPNEPSEDQWSQIDACLDQKIEAIRLYRKFTNADLLTAKNAVEARERGAVVAARASSGTVDWSEIDALLRTGKTISAIKMYREQTGVGLKDAKDAVERRIPEVIESRKSQTKGIGCGAISVLVVLLLGGAFFVWWKLR